MWAKSVAFYDQLQVNQHRKRQLIAVFLDQTTAVECEPHYMQDEKVRFSVVGGR